MIHFVVGTRAQLLKLAPVMVECRRRGLAWRWVYSAQHRETFEQLLATFELPPPDYVLVRWDDEARSVASMGRWFARMTLATMRPRRALAGLIGPRHVVVTHGDTFTTWFGALLGKLTRTPVLHVESGLRSFNLRKPFPEELNRIITFRLANLYACQDAEAIANLKRRKGFKFNTHGNTQIDTLRFGLANSDRVEVDVPEGDYAVVTLHRYENIFDAERFTRIVSLLRRIADDVQLIFIQHPATRLQLEKLGLLEQLTSHRRIHMLAPPRIPAVHQGRPRCRVRRHRRRREPTGARVPRKTDVDLPRRGRAAGGNRRDRSRLTTRPCGRGRLSRALPRLRASGVAAGHLAHRDHRGRSRAARLRTFLTQVLVRLHVEPHREQREEDRERHHQRNEDRRCRRSAGCRRSAPRPRSCRARVRSGS